MFNRKYGLVVAWIAAVLLLLAVSAAAQSILTQTSLGTGFIVSSDGYIITNKHVIKGATDITVKIGDKEYKAKVVDSLADNDIALLKIDAHGLPTVMLGDSDKVGIGDTVYAIGCPAGVCGTITEGRVANLGISSKGKEGATLHDLIMTDLTTTHGSSGGPLLNDKGEVIGITTAGIVVQGETTGFGVSIPINQAIPLLQKVPGFSTSQMGKATRVLSLNEIRQTVGVGTLLVQAEVQRPLTDLLPRQALGGSLEIATGTPLKLLQQLIHSTFPSFEKAYQCFLDVIRHSPFSPDTTELLLYLHAKGIKLIRAGEAYNKIETGEIANVVIVDVFECASPTEASRALAYLSKPVNWPGLTESSSGPIPIFIIPPDGISPFDHLTPNPNVVYDNITKTSTKWPRML